MKIQVFTIGSTLIDADPEWQEPDIRQDIRTNADVAGTIIDLTDTERSNISCDEYAVVCEDDGVLLWHGWLTSYLAADPPPQARRWITQMSAADRAAKFSQEEPAGEN